MTALIVTALTISLISYSIRYFEAVERLNFHDRQLEWHLFLNQLEYDLKDSTFVNHSSTAFSVDTPNKKTGSIERITYDKNLSVFRRRVGGQGHQPMLMEVNTLRFSKKDNGLTADVTFINGETYTAWIDLRESMERMTDE